MKNFILILITAFALVGCSSNPVKNTQWEVVPNTLEEISLISFGDNDCTFYMKSTLNGNTTTAKFGYDVSDNVITFSPIDVHMENYPVFIIDGDFLIFKHTNLPTFKKVK